MPATVIRELPGRGRCVVADRFYSPGDLVILEEPYAMVVAATHAEIACSYCCTICESGTMYALSSASMVRYCSVKCITDDHPVHQFESPTVTALEDAGVQGPGWDAMRLVFRIASYRKLQQTKKSVRKEEHVPLNGRANTFEHIQLLEANTKSTSPEMAREVSRTAAELAKIANKHSLPLSTVDARSLLYSIQCNAHQIVSSQSGAAGIALGIFPLTSMMNHSCSPNCSHRFHLEPGKPPRLVMRAIANIDKGDELCYSYVNLYQSTAARREQLQNAYSFHCSCERCSSESSHQEEQHSLSISLQPSTSRAFGFVSDGVIDQLADFSDADEVAAVERLIESHAVDSEELTLQRLQTFLRSSDAGMFHPAHRIMFRCYHSVCMTSIRLAANASNRTSNSGSGSSGSAMCTVSSLRASIGCGLLALGCMRVYVQRRHSEMGELEEQIVKGAELLVSLLLDAPCPTTDTAIEDHTTEQCTCVHDAMPDSSDAVLSLLLEVGYVSSIYLGVRGDGRLRELVKAACGLNTSSSAEMRSDDDTLFGQSHSPAHVPFPQDASSAQASRSLCGVNEREQRVLQHMILKFKRSAEYIAFVCRPNVDTADLTDS